MSMYTCKNRPITEYIETRYALVNGIIIGSGNNWIISGSGNGLTPNLHQAISWINYYLLSLGPKTHLNKIAIKMQKKYMICEISANLLKTHVKL